MRRFMIVNPKGGCGKSTLATNLAAYYAIDGASVALADYDPQKSSLGWLDIRANGSIDIQGLEAFEEGLWGVESTTDYLIIDTPARTTSGELNRLVPRADAIIVPVLPSPIDMQATERFLDRLLQIPRVRYGQIPVGLIANRVREKTLINEELQTFLGSLGLDHVATFRDAQNYVRAFTRGMSIFELPEYLAKRDWEQWAPLLSWLEES